MRRSNSGGDIPPRRGRPRKRRVLNKNSQYRCFEPCCHPDAQGRINILEPGELEALRLVDLLDLDQETAAAKMGISRKTLWRDLHEGRRKVVETLVEGKRLEMAGCSDLMRKECGAKSHECGHPPDASVEQKAE